MSTTNAAVGLTEDAFDGDSARRALDADDPEVAALVRAVLARTHGHGSAGQPSGPILGGDVGEGKEGEEGAPDGPPDAAANGVYAPPSGEV